MQYCCSSPPAPAHAARPFVTDDARVVDQGGCQIETFVKSQRRYDENEIWFVPACNPWGVELTAGHIKVDGNQNGNSSTVLLQAKTLLKPLVTNGAGFALLAGRVRRPHEQSLHQRRSAVFPLPMTGS